MELAERLARVRWLFLDVDGVLTDGRIHYDTEGGETKAFDVADGQGLKLLQRAGVEVGPVTGARDEVSGRVRGLVEMVKRHTSLPTGVGFGISTSEHVAEIGEFADGAVVGSALIRAIDDGPVDSASERAADFIRELSGGSVRKKETAS